MEKLGTVTNIADNIAEIKIIRDSACGDNCAACGLCPNREMTLSLPVADGLKAGDTVRLKTDSSAFIKKTAFGYLSLTLLLLLGGILGALSGNQWLGFLLGIGFLGIGIFVIRKFFSQGAQIHIEILTR